MGFKAVIVGGGVGGLALASMLEQLEVDYVLLEAYGDFSPQAGASIGMLPNGLRILEQLGCRSAFGEGVPLAQKIRITRMGKRLTEVDGFSDALVQRHAGGVEFNDRQILLRALHANIKDKKRLLLNKKVIKVTTGEKSAVVETQDGHRYEGDVVVGLDGIWSTVRSEMRREAAEKSPGYFPDDEWKRVPIYCKCMFGISRPNKAIQPGTMTEVINRGFLYLVLGGPGGRVFFFLSEKLPKKLYGPESPRYSKEENVAFAEAHRQDVIIDDCTFGDIWDNIIAYNVTPLHEYAFDQWHYGRIITLGDAAHKVDPVAGQGGNAALESVAAFTNALMKRLDRLPADDPSATLPLADIEAILRETQATRHERARRVVRVSHEMQDAFAKTSWLGMQLTRLAPWIIDKESLLEKWAVNVTEAVKVERLPDRSLPHVVPFTTDLPAKPISSSSGLVKLERGLVGTALAALSWLAGHGVRSPGPLPTSLFGVPFRQSWTGRAGPDKIVALLTKLFAVSLTSPVPEQRLQLAYFVPVLAPALVIWVIEGNRWGNKQTLLGRILTWPGIFTGVAQLLTIARVSPVYFLLTLLAGRNDLVHRKPARSVDPALARAVLPAVALGYVLPSVLMLLPPRVTGAGRFWQDVLAYWQLSPATVGPLASLIAWAATTLATKKQGKEEAPKDLERHRGRDLPHLLKAYNVVFWAAAACHIGVVGYALASPSVSLCKMLFGVPLPRPFASATTPDWSAGLGPADISFVLFRWDLLIFASAVVTWCLHTVFEMRRLGYVTAEEAKRTALVKVLGSLVAFGPGAVYAGVWAWREKAIAEAGRGAGDAGEKKTQ